MKYLIYLLSKNKRMSISSSSRNLSCLKIKSNCILLCIFFNQNNNTTPLSLLHTSHKNCLVITIVLEMEHATQLLVFVFVTNILQILIVCLLCNPYPFQIINILLVFVFIQIIKANSFFYIFLS